MPGCEHISVVDQSSAAVEFILVEYRYGPRKQVRDRDSPADNTIRYPSRYSTLCRKKGTNESIKSSMCSAYVKVDGKAYNIIQTSHAFV